ncbi:hypothetical protein FUAX_47140 (plasmid) [Fulvitalea axinellae]|uniref:Transposase IS30-like HTH domain-containing protein n=1 Tax=Fulvitalea axinellae TaxID=1182444 RepID=A0AAU9CWK7_9BACT|nr:hypothetical protein FUAX_47140 [Fulvitalea axinellae]
MKHKEKAFGPRLPQRHRQLDEEARHRLSYALRRGLKQKEIAQLIGVHPATVGRELRRNSPMGFYDPALAQRLYRMRKIVSAMSDRMPFQNLMRQHAFSVLSIPRNWILWFSDTNKYERNILAPRFRYRQWEKRKHRLPETKRFLYTSRFPRELAWWAKHYAMRLFARHEKPYQFLKDRVLLALMHWYLDQLEKEKPDKNRKIPKPGPIPEIKKTNITPTETDDGELLWPKVA